LLQQFNSACLSRWQRCMQNKFTCSLKGL
jgi:hypothetical protein